MSSGFSVATNEHLIRSNLWSKQLKQLLLDDLFAMKFVRILTDFPDGTTFNIPSIGEAESQDFSEGQAIRYSRLDTGNYTFTWDQYKYSAHSVTAKFKRDSYYAAEVLAAFAPREHRALMEAVEARILSRPNAAQDANDLNIINGAAHRFVGNGTNESIALRDFALADFALVKAQVPNMNKVAIVDPSVAFTLQTQTNLVNLLTPQPIWGDLVRKTNVTGMRFIGSMQIYGFDIYVSNYLPRSIAETIDGKTTTAGVSNLFFSAAPGDTMPIIGGFKQMPTVYSEWNKDLQQDEHLTICEYGFQLYRPENMVIVLTDTDVVS